MQINEIHISSKRSSQVGTEFFTFECAETIGVEGHTDEEIEEIKKEAFERCNACVDEQYVDAKNG